jgi:hypothetical protein
VWLGSVIFDATHSYAWLWVGSIVLGVLSGLLHLPIDDRRVARFKPGAALSV